MYRAAGGRSFAKRHHYAPRAMPSGTPTCAAAAKASRAKSRRLPRPSPAYRALTAPLSPAQLGGTAADGVVWVSSLRLLAGVDLGRNLIECSSIFCTPGATSHVLLPAANTHVHVKRIQFD